MTEQPTGKTYVGSDELYADVQRTLRLCAEMNTEYHTEAEVRDCLREITRSQVPDTVRVFTPLNINYGPVAADVLSCPSWRMFSVAADL